MKKASRFSLCCIYTRKPWNCESLYIVTACLVLLLFWNSSNVKKKKIYLSINEWPVNFYPNLPWEVDFGTGDALSTKVITDKIQDLHTRGPTILPHNKSAPPGQVPTGPRASVAWLVQSWKSSVHVQTPVSYQLKIKAPRSTAGQCSHSRCRDGFYQPNNWSWVKGVVGTHRADTLMNSSDALLRSELLPFNTCRSTALTEASWTGGGSPVQ